MGNARLNDPYLYIQAGIDPKTKLPLKAAAAKEGFKANNRKQLRIMDEQDAINSFTWYNLPQGLNGRLMERILYYKGQGMFFYMKETDSFYFLPYALDGTIDVYGRFTGVTPLPFNGTTSTDKDKKETPWITGLTRTPVYDVKLDEVDWDFYTGSCVLIHDYSQQISQTNISRQILNDPLLDIMSDCIPFMRTSLLNSTGIKGMRVNSQDEYNNIIQANGAIENAALIGQWGVPVIGNVDFQDLTSGATGKSEEFLLALQALDSYRLSLHGLPNGGLFQKKAHMLEAEQNLNTGTASLVLQDRLKNRQDACEIINSAFGLDVWCDINETIINTDTNADGVFYDNGSDVISTSATEEATEGGIEYDV